MNEALEFIETVPSDGALIDVNLGGELAVPVRQALFRRGIPRIVVTGYNNAPPMLDGFPVVHKPFEPGELRDTLVQHLDRHSRMRKHGNYPCSSNDQPIWTTWPPSGSLGPGTAMMKGNDPR